MIKSWQIFNESTSNELTKEQAQEIIYYFSEMSEPTQKIVNNFYSLDGFDDDHFSFFEISYEEMIQYTRDLQQRCKGNEELTNKMIEIYEEIREERKIFPEAHEIESIFSDFMDLEDFYFMIYSDKMEYTIRLGKTPTNLGSFTKYCQDIQKYLVRLESGDYETKLVKCEFTDYRIGRASFEIELKRNA
jgi:hypothetical protein